MRGKYLLVVLCLMFISSVRAQNDKMKALEIQGDTLLNRQDYQGALKIFSKVLKASKEKNQAYYSLLYKIAVSQYSIGQYDEALRSLDEFIPAYPSFPQAHFLKAFIYREKGEAEGQLKSIESALLLQPGNPDMLKWRAMLYLDVDRYKEAIQDLKQVKQLQDDPEVETYMGLAYYNMEEKDSAFMSLNKAIEIDATYQPSYLYAGSFALQDDEFDTALKYLNLALRLDAKNYTALFYKGVALIGKEKIDEGCSCLAKAFYTGKIDDAGDYLKQDCYGEEN